VSTALGKIGRNGGDLAEGIGRHALLRHEHADRVVGSDLRFECENVRARDLLDPQAMLAPQRPADCVFRERLLVRVEAEQAGVAYDLGRTDLG
jgi:hypothetical protein